MPTLTIDGKPVTVPNGATVIQACKQIGIDIPHYCYHPGLRVVASCRMCQVEIEKMPRLQTACSCPVAEGMVVRTDTPKAKEGRKAVLEFLLVNHPLDCPIGDKAGECDLQNYWHDHDKADTRRTDPRWHKPKVVDTGPTIVLDAERCVLCSRCVRFMDDVAKQPALGIVNRGHHSEIALFPGMTLDNPYSLNVVDLCPVGALTSKDFRFKERVWNMKAAASVCGHCANGCNTWVEHDGRRLFRVRPRDNMQVNGYFMCDVGRLNYPMANNPARIVDAWTGSGSGRAKLDWKAAAAAVAARFASLQTAHGPGSVAVVVSNQAPNEAVHAAVRLVRDAFPGAGLAFLKTETGLGEVRVPIAPVKPGQAAVVVPEGPLPAPAENVGPSLADDYLLKADKNPNTRGVVEILAAAGVNENALGDLFGDIRNGRVRGLLLFDPDLATRHPNGAQVLADLRKLEFLALGCTLPNSALESASVVLPIATLYETEGTVTRFDGRVQRLRVAFTPRGRSRTALDAIRAVAAEAGKPFEESSVSGFFDRMASDVKFFQGMTWAQLGTQGVVAGAATPAVAPERRAVSGER